MYTVEDLTNRYGVTVHTVLTWIRSGELKAVNVGRTPGARKPRWRVSEEALAEFEAKRTQMPPVPRSKRRKRPTDVIEFYT
jgi:excisionase family DNA binding protein